MERRSPPAADVNQSRAARRGVEVDMHVEAMESRRLMAAAGLDVTFADRGSLFPVPTDASLVTADALYLVGESTADDGTSRATITKYNRRGKLDTAWGRRGRVETSLPRANQIASDARTGDLYVTSAGYASSDELGGVRVRVQHITRTGQLDSDYGEGGVALPYTVDRIAGLNVGVSVEKLVVLDGGKLLLGVSVYSGEDAEYLQPGRTTEDVKVMRLRADGSPDRAFNGRGFLNLLSGRGTSTSQEHGSSFDGVDINLDDLVAETDGTYRAVLTRTDGGGYYSDFSPGPAALRGQVSLKSRTLTTGGKIDEAKAYSWTLRPDVPDADEVRVFLAEYDGRDRVVVVTDRGAGVAFGRLTPGKRVSTRVVPTGRLPGVDLVARNDDGNLFLSSDKSVIRVLDSLKVDRRFADSGLGTVASTQEDIDLLLPDGGNGVLASYYEINKGQFLARFV